MSYVHPCECEECLGLRAEVENLKAAHMADMIGLEHRLGTQLEQAQRENARLRGALAFYAVEDRWAMATEYDKAAGRFFLSMPMDRDKGAIAREALEEK